MPRKNSNKKEKGFMEKLEKYAGTILTDVQKVTIAKRKYLNNYKNNIIEAQVAGYSYGMIADFATNDLLAKIDLPKSYTFVSKEGESITRQTKITATEIKNKCEENDI